MTDEHAVTSAADLTPTETTVVGAPQTAAEVLHVAHAQPRPPTEAASASDRALRSPDLDVLASVEAILLDLTAAERGRVVAWLAAKYDRDIPKISRRPVAEAPPAQAKASKAAARAVKGGSKAPKAAKAHKPPKAAKVPKKKPAKAVERAPVAKVVAVGAGAVDRVRAAAKAKQPGSLTERFLLVLQVLGDGTTTRDIAAAAKQAGIKMQNPAYGGFAAAQQGLAKRSGKKWSLTAVGKKKLAEMGR